MTTTAVLPPPRVAGNPAPEQKTLSRDAIGGARTTAIAHVLRTALGLLTTALLAKSLSPAEFGLVGMAAVVVGFVVLFKDLGTGTAVVQRKSLNVDMLASLFWTNCLIGCLGTLVLALLAPWIAALFEEKALVGPLIGLAAVLALTGPAVVPQALMQRELRFGALARIELVAQVIGAVVAISLARLGGGCWSLVTQVLVSNAFATVVTLAVSGYRPALSYSTASLHGVASVSGPLVGFQVFNYFARNADQALLGRFAGAAAVGDYALATRLVMQPLGSVAQIMHRVLLPVYARMQDDASRMQAAYLRAVGAVATTLFPILALVIALAEPIVLGVFGESWRGVVPLLRCLGWVGLVQTVTSTTAVVYQAHGRTDLMFGWGLVSGCAALVAFWVSAGAGPAAVAQSYLWVSLILLYPGLWLPCRILRLPLGFLAAEVAMPALLAGLTGLLVTWLDSATASAIDPLLRVLVVGAIGAAAYLAGLLLFDRDHARDVRRILRGGAL